MVSEAIIGIIIQMGMVVLLCIGFTFTHQIEGFPNFAHIGFAVIGSAITFHMTRFVGLNPYLTWPISGFLCGLMGVLFYVFIVIPIKRKRDDPIAITISFYALSIVLKTMVAMYGYWMVRVEHETTRGFALKRYDFTAFDLPGVAIVTPVLCVCLVMILYYGLTNTCLLYTSPSPRDRS